MADNKLLHADLTYTIRAVLFHVGNHLWPGLPERDFQQAVSVGLSKRKIPHSLEEQFHVYYRGVEVGRYYCDVVVDRSVILELKAVPALTGLHRAQIISYLRVTGADVGLLVNFGGPKVEVERYTYFYAQRRPDFTWQPRPPDDPTLLYPDLSGVCTSAYTASTTSSVLASSTTSIAVQRRLNCTNSTSRFGSCARCPSSTREST